MKIVSLDIETTGINLVTSDILEFGCVLDDLNIQKPIEELPRLHCYFLPTNNLFQGEPYALSMHPTIFRRIAEKTEGYNYKSPQKFGYFFKQFLLQNGYTLEDDRVIINVAGKNPSFDISFLEDKTDILKHVKMRHRVIDPSILFLEKDDDAIPGLSQCKQRMGLNKEVAHNAIDDALDVIKMIRFKTSMLYGEK